MQQEDAELPLPAWPRERFQGNLGGHRGGPALAVLWSTAALSPSSGQATNRRVEDGRVGKGENQCALFFFFLNLILFYFFSKPKVTGLGRA